MEGRIPGFRGEYLWELDIARGQLIALAEAVPEGVYGWRPAEEARSFSEVLVHIAATNRLYLEMTREKAACALDRVVAAVRGNSALEKTLTEKAAVIGLLRSSFDEVARMIATAPDEELGRPGEFFGEVTTVRRVYLRALAHAHEHMGQSIAYARANGIRVPWENPLEELERMTVERSSRQAAFESSHTPLE